jgi:hypothetical protein
LEISLHEGLTIHWAFTFPLLPIAPTSSRGLETNNTGICDVSIYLAHDGTTPVVYFDGAQMTLTFSTSTDKTKWLQGTAITSVGARSTSTCSFHSLTAGAVVAGVWTPFLFAPFAMNTYSASADEFAVYLTTQAAPVIETIVTSTGGFVEADEIATTLKTREYLLGQSALAKRFSSGEVTVLGRNPKFSVTALSRGGTEQVALLSDVQYSSTESDFHDGTVWNGDETTFNAEGRSNMAPVILPASGIVLQTLGIPLDREVEHTDAFWNGKVDAGTQLQVTNTQGTMALKSVMLSASSQGSSLRRNR